MLCEHRELLGLWPRAREPGSIDAVTVLLCSGVLGETAAKVREPGVGVASGTGSRGLQG